MPTAIRVPTIAIKVLEQSVMVFSKNYLPLSRANIKRGIILLVTGNQRKSDRTPLEAGMPLHTKPKAPVHPTVAEAEQFWRSEQANLE